MDQHTLADHMPASSTMPTSVEQKPSPQVVPAPVYSTATPMYGTAISVNHPRDPLHPTEPRIITPPIPSMKEADPPTIEHIDAIARMKAKDLTCVICTIKRQIAIETPDGVICPSCIGRAAIKILRNETQERITEKDAASIQPMIEPQRVQTIKVVKRV